jgi:hypothetical protein
VWKSGGLWQRRQQFTLSACCSPRWIVEGRSESYRTRILTGIVGTGQSAQPANLLSSALQRSISSMTLSSREGVPSYWRPAHAPGAAPMHLAFAAPEMAAVDAFYAAALASGGCDNGAPGLGRKVSEPAQTTSLSSSNPTTTTSRPHGQIPAPKTGTNPGAMSVAHISRRARHRLLTQPRRATCQHL